MVFTTPALLLGLACLPVLWWLLRATPPAPRDQLFPAVRLLRGLAPVEETPARTPLWLLALRLLITALLIMGAAGPVMRPAQSPPGRGPLLLVIDNGWSAAADWPARVQAAAAALERADRFGRPVLLLPTAPQLITAVAPHPHMPVSAAVARSALMALRPQPWPEDRAAIIDAIKTAHAGWTVYIAGGVAMPNDPAFLAALSAAGPVYERRAPGVTLLRAASHADHDLVATLDWTIAAPSGCPSIMAQTADGQTLAAAPCTLTTHGGKGTARFSMPSDVQNRVVRLILQGAPTVGGTLLLDDMTRRHPVGLLAGGDAANAPLTGPLFYLRRALGPASDITEGDLTALLNRKQAVIVVADQRLSPDDANRLLQWVRAGGTLIRFAGEHDTTLPDDPLLPRPLLPGERQLGGALSWNKPAHLAPFSDASPFAGLAIPPDVTVSRQWLAAPGSDTAAQNWAALEDGTPLVTAAARGAGQLVLFHVTANTEWSNLPLSGLFPDMLQRIVRRAAGVMAGDNQAMLPPTETLDAFGALVPAIPGAQSIRSNQIDTIVASPEHPPGLYGPEDGRRALNLGPALPPLQTALDVPGATIAPIDHRDDERALGPPLIAIALVLWAVDMLIGLRLRGLLLVALLLLSPDAVHAASTPENAVMAQALQTRLAYVSAGDGQIEVATRMGLAALSLAVNRRTAAELAEPAPVEPGRDDLSFYPLLYWPVISTAMPSAAGIAALNEYMRHGGILVIDTRDGGHGDAADALRRAANGLDIPPLARLTDQHVLAHDFYILHSFPGRLADGPVWVGRDQAGDGDDVSPVVIGGNDWAAAWAGGAEADAPVVSDPDPYAPPMATNRQGTLALRFGINLVMYALTGNYKADQMTVPALLERLGH